MSVELGQRDILTVIVKLLDRYKIPYLLTGSFAVSFYGYPRATHDIDLIVEVDKDTSSKLVQSLDELDSSYTIDQRQVLEAVRKKSQFDIFHSPTSLKIDFWIRKEDEFEKSKFERRRLIKLDKQVVFIPKAEDLILTKLLWCKKVKSDKHMRDCAGMIKVQKDKLDNKYLKNWARKLSLSDLLISVSKMNY